jgi:hypothetical protein
MEQLKVATNDLPSVAKKKIAAATASMSSTEAFPTTVIALQLEVATTAVVSVPSWKGGGSAGTLAWLAGGGGGHVGGCLAAGDPPHDITGVGPV